MGDVVAQINRSGGFRGDEAAGGDFGGGQEGYVDGVGKEVKEAFAGAGVADGAFGGRPA